MLIYSMIVYLLTHRWLNVSDIDMANRQSEGICRAKRWVELGVQLYTYC